MASDRERQRVATLRARARRLRAQGDERGAGVATAEADRVARRAGIGVRRSGVKEREGLRPAAQPLQRVGQKGQAGQKIGSKIGRRKGLQRIG